MKIFRAFLHLIRWPNLVFIVLCQALFNFCVLPPILKSTPPIIDTFYWILLSLASVFIAAAGYIINDYFDVNIDLVNKPEKLVIGKDISRRWAIFWHSTFSFLGVLISFIVGYKTHIFWIGLANIFCTFLLFVYSTTFKRKFLTGNIIIAALTGWSVAIIGLATFYGVVQLRSVYGAISAERILRLTILYTSFAFIISLIREAIKDMEDMEGDLRYACRTLPIVAGIPATKIYVAVWIVVLIAAVLIIQIYVLQFFLWIPFFYSIFFIALPLYFLLRRLIRSKTKTAFHELSSWCKWIMLSGIVSMIFFRIYS